MDESEKNGHGMSLRTARKRKRSVAIRYEEAAAITDHDSVYFARQDLQWQPSNWKKMLSNVEIMRSKRDAPVDGMGCEQCVDQDQPAQVRIRKKIENPRFFVAPL